MLTNTQIRIYRTLKINGPMVRYELAYFLNIPRTTIYDNLKKLEKKGLVEWFDRNNGRSRPYRFWEVVKG